MPEKIISNWERILGTIELTTEYDIPTVSDIILRARTEIITKGLDSNFITLFEDRALSSELSDVSEDFESMAVDDDDNVEEP